MNLIKSTVYGSHLSSNQGNTTIILLKLTELLKRHSKAHTIFKSSESFEIKNKYNLRPSTSFYTQVLVWPVSVTTFMWTRFVSIPVLRAVKHSCPYTARIESVFGKVTGRSLESLACFLWNKSHYVFKIVQEALKRRLEAEGGLPRVHYGVEWSNESRQCFHASVVPNPGKAPPASQIPPLTTAPYMESLTALRTKGRLTVSLGVHHFRCWLPTIKARESNNRKLF